MQASILLALGLQRKTVEDVEKELSLPVNQCLALLVKMVRKLGKKLAEVRREEVEKTLPAPAAGANAIAVGQKEKGDEWKTVGERMEKELEEAGDDVQKELKEKQRAMLESLDLRK